MQWIRTTGRRLILLSPQEQRVTRLISRGITNRAIAGLLGISLSTVKRHVSRLLAQLRLRNRVQLATWALLHPPALEGIAVEPDFEPLLDRVA